MLQGFAAERYILKLDTRQWNCKVGMVTDLRTAKSSGTDVYPVNNEVCSEQLTYCRAPMDLSPLRPPKAALGHLAMGSTFYHALYISSLLSGFRKAHSVHPGRTDVRCASSLQGEDMQLGLKG